MTRQELEARALAHYHAALGTVIEATWVYGYRDEDSVEVLCDPRARVRVTDTDPESLLRWCGEWLDPYWEVELAEPHPALDGVRSLFAYGPSHRLGDDHPRDSSPPGSPRLTP